MPGRRYHSNVITTARSIRLLSAGFAEVTKDDETFILHENESVYLPPLSIHRLVNPGKIPLNLIEVQSGSDLGENDIERYEDIYRRN
jgi:mannose-1-phosphate guanylyltransferase/mannose-6-phosphate isomerase